MSNNLFRKGLATGAVLALGAAALTATPASAAGEINVVPSAGTSYNIFVTDTFNLVTTMAPGYTPSSYAQLKYQIVTDGVATIKAGVNANSTVATAVSGIASATLPSLTGNSNNTYVVSASRASAGSANSTAYTANDAGSAVSSTSINDLALQVSGATASTTSTSVTVTAFVDANNDGALTAGEWNTVRTVGFKKYADVTPTVTFTTPNAADTSLVSTVSYGDLNVEQAAGAFTVAYTGATGGNGSASLSSGKYTKTGVTVTGGDVISAQAAYAATTLGTAVSKTAVSRTITDLATTGATLVTGDDATATTARVNKAFTTRVLVKDTASTPAALAGVSVTATVAASTALSSTHYLTINGTNYTTDAALAAASFALTSGADGYASLTVTPVGFLATETVTVTFAAQNYTVSKTVTEAAAAYTVTTTDALASTYRKSAHGATTSVDYTVADQFGVVPAGSYRLVATLSGTGFSNVVTYNAVTAGKATVAWVDPSTSTGSTDTAATVLQVQGTDGNWSNVAGATNSTITINNSSAAGAYTTTPASTASGTVSTDSAYKAGGNAPVTLTVRSAVAGSSIKLSGTGLGFELNSKIYTDSVTFVDNGADATVKVYSFTSGAQTVTTTVDGVASKSSVITYAAAAAALVSIAAPANAQAGQALDVVFTVTDVHGNAKQVTTSAADDGHLVISSTGAGYLATTGTVATNAKGQYTVKLITGAADLATSYINATLDLATDVTVGKSIEFGLTDADVVAGGHRVFVDYSFAKGKTLTITIDGVRKYSSVVANDNPGELAFTQKKKGYHTVTVRISGGIVFTEKVKTN